MKKIYNPISFDINLRSTLAEDKPNFPFHVDHFRFILGTVVELLITRDDTNGYVNVSSKILDDKIKHASKCLRWLVKHRFLECDDLFVVRKKCRGYRLLDPYASEPLVAIELTKTTLVKASDYDERMKRKYHFMHRWLNEKLTIDREAAYRYAYDVLANDTSKIFKDPKTRINRIVNTVDRIHRNDQRFRIDPNVGRSHTNLTVLKSELRNFMLYDGQRIVCIDIKNSQPFISTVLFPVGGVSSKVNLLSSPLSVTSSLSPDPWNSPLHIRKNTYEPSTLLYIDLCCRGVLYEYIEPRLKAYIGDAITDRKALKAVVFQTIFSRNTIPLSIEWSAPKRLFKELFPEVFAAYERIKAGKHNALACYLQRLEAQVMLDRIARRISEEHPTLPIWSIHDSICTLVGHEEYVASIIRQEMTDRIGYTPTVDFQYWTPDNLNQQSVA